MRLFNGTPGLLIATSRWVLHVRVVTGPNARWRAFVPRCKLMLSEGELPFVFTQRQFPVSPCFAMSINNVHGQTLEGVGILLRRPVIHTGNFTWQTLEGVGILLRHPVIHTGNFTWQCLGQPRRRISSSWSWEAAHLCRTVRRKSAPPRPSMKRWSTAQGDGRNGLYVR